MKDVCEGQRNVKDEEAQNVDLNIKGGETNLYVTCWVKQQTETKN